MESKPTSSYKSRTIQEVDEFTDTGYLQTFKDSKVNYCYAAENLKGEAHLEDLYTNRMLN
jgi:hypothetical protein